MSASLEPMREPKVLVIDDSATVLRVVEAVLVRAGYEVVCLDSGKDAVEVARRMQPGMIIVDFAMPDVSGFGVCRALGREPQTEGIPIVLMNTRGDPVGDRFVRQLGIVDHITKPFAPEALLALVEHVLERPTSSTRHRPPPPPKDQEGAPADGVNDDGRPAPGGVVLQGDLHFVPAAEVLQLLSLQRQTGVLTIRRGASEICIFFKDGQVRLVTGSNLSPELLLGSILVQEKLITNEELAQLLANRRGTHRLLGSQVVQLGYLTREDLQRALHRQSSELVYEMLRWGEGLFAFERREELTAEVLEFDFGISIDVLLMEGFRRVDEWGLIETVLKSFRTVPRVAPGGAEHLGTPGLTPDETQLLAAIDGKRSVHEIIRHMGLPAFEVARLLYRLASAHVVQLPPAPAPMADLDTLA